MPEEERQRLLDLNPDEVIARAIERLDEVLADDWNNFDAATLLRPTARKKLTALRAGVDRIYMAGFEPNAFDDPDPE